MVPVENAALVAEMLSALTVFESPNLRMVRVGSRNDGGYVLPDLGLGSVDFLYSAGVGYNLDFDHEFRARSGARIKLFDPTIAPPANLPEEAEFYPIGLGVHDHSLTTLFHFGDRPNLSKHRVWLKVDVEGWEWPTLQMTATECLQVFEVIAIEFHGMTDFTRASLQLKIAGLSKLNRSFHMIHAHGNNYTPWRFAHGALVPFCLEATYLRSDLMPADMRPNRHPLPGPLDAPSNPGAPDLDLNCWPYRSG